MPIYKRGDQKIHFVHIPKTGGMSIRYVLEENGWSNVYDEHKGNFFVGDAKPYHGHMPYSYWKNWNVASECEFEFAVVRSPSARVRSLIEMFLRGFFASKADHAWSSGGYAPEDFLKEMGLLAQSGYTNFDVKNALGQIYLPDTNAELIQTAHDNNMTTAEVVHGIQRNRSHLEFHVATREILEATGRHLAKITWIDLLDYYLSKSTGTNNECHGVHPTPMSRYPGPNTRIYRLEKIDHLLSELKELGYIEDSSNLPCLNQYPNMLMKKNLHEVSNLNNEKLFWETYEEDFEKFSYEKII